MEMNIVIALNEKYFYYAYVMLRSLFENNKESNINLFVLYSDLSEQSLREFAALTKTSGGIFYPTKIERSLFPKELPTDEKWSIEIYYRLALLDVLPEWVDKILYLDSDIIINKDIQELYNTDFEGNDFIVCEDQPFQFMPSESFERRSWKVYEPVAKLHAKYFNSGVMLWNLKSLRGRYSLAHYLHVLEELQYQVFSPDQDLLNYLHYNHVKWVDSNRYNQFATIAFNQGFRYPQVKNQTSIIHYAGRKPWDAANAHLDIEMIWWEYAKLTPWYTLLCEEFILKTMQDMSGLIRENYVNELLAENETLKQKLDESLEINGKLIHILDSLDNGNKN